MDVLAITTAGYGGRLCFLDEVNLCYAGGHGVVIHDKDTGLQKHIWTLSEGQGHPPPNMAPATFATCPGGHLLAYVQQGGLQQVIQVVQQETLLPASTIKDAGVRHVEFAQLVFDTDGTRLASIGGPPDFQLDVWDVDLKESLLRLSLPESLTGIEPAFFPLNSEVLAVAGPDSARLLWDEPLAGTRIVRQSDVDLSLLTEGERLNCLCWTPNGTLLLATSAGRLLGVKCAAPPAVPAHGWGTAAGGGHVAELMYGEPEPTVAVPPARPLVLPSAPSVGAGFGAGVTPARTGVAAVVVTATHVLLVVAGEANSPAELLWLSPEFLVPIATSELPMSAIVRAVPSPSFEHIAISAADGTICLCGTACPVSNPTAGHRLTEEGSNANNSSVPQPQPPGPSPSPLAHTRATVTAGKAALAAAIATASTVPPAAGGGVGSASVSFAVTLGASPLAAPPPPTRHAPVKADPVQVTEVARFHRGPLSACLWLTTRRFVTGGMDGSVRMWSYVPNDVEPPDTAQWMSPAIVLEATWDASQPVTTMAALNPPLPSGAELPAGADTYGEADAAWGGAAPKPPAFLIGTAGGVVQLVNADRVPANPADAPDQEMMVKSLLSTWDVRVFNGPVTAAAFSQDGRFCALSCASEAKICFLRVMVLGHELSMRVLGFYPMREPRHLAWAPPEPGSIHPLLVVGTILGELVVLGIPDSSALEECSVDGVLTRGSLVRASMRAQSQVTSLTVYPLPAPDARGGGHFWVITSHTDKSIRRYRLFTDQHKATAAATVRAFAVAAAAGSDATAVVANGGGATAGPYRVAGGSNDAGHNRVRPSTGQNLGRAISMAPGNQNFQMPDAEKPMELQLPATAMSISLMPGGGGLAGPAVGGGGGGMYGSPLRMAVASSDGSVSLYSMPEIALQGRWLLHEIVAGGAAGVCLLGDRLLSVGGEGSVQVLELSNVARGARHATHRGSHGLVPAIGSPLPSSTVSRPSVTVGAAAQRSAFFSATGPPRPRGMERATLGSLLPVHMKPAMPTICTTAGAAPTWQEARSQATRELYREQLTTFRAKAQAKCREWVERIKELQKLNEAAEEVEKLSPEEFVIDLALRRQMEAEGEARYTKAKAQEARAMQVMQYQRHRLKEECLGFMECISRPLLALPEYTFISPMDASEARRYRFEGEAAAARTAADGGVWSYGLRKMTPAQELRFRQVSFLRKVEQEECASRTFLERGAVVPIRRYKGDMQRRFNLLTEEEQQQQQQQQQQGQQQPGQQGPGSPGFVGQPSGQLGASTPVGAAGLSTAPSTQRPTQGYDEYDEYDDDPQSLSRKGTRRARDDGFEGTESGYGETGLLYADVQLYTHCRRAAQVVFIQEEVRCLRRLFNAKWEQSRVAKQKALDRIDERLGRIVEIQKELTKLALEEGCGEAPAPAPQHVPGGFYEWAPEEISALSEVKDEEVKVAKYVSPEELARRAAEAAAEAEARRRAEADDARNRALKEMMNSNPAVTRKARGGGKNRLVREAWMDLPPGQMSKDQRLKLAEWERKRAEIAEELEKHRRLLEAERRALEVEIVETAAAVNTDLARLANAKVRMDMEIVHLERRTVDIADTAAALTAAEAARQALVAHLSSFTTRRSRRSPLLAALEQRVLAAQKAFDDIALSEKQVDKAFRREFSSRPELWDDAQKVYRTRAHLLQASPSTGSIGIDGASGANGRLTGRLPNSKTPLELLGKSPEGQALAAVLEAPGLAESSVAHSIASSQGTNRQTTASRLTGRVNAFDSLGGASGGATGPDALMTTPRHTLRDMAHLARPQPRPGSSLHDFARHYLDGKRANQRPEGEQTGHPPLPSSSGGAAGTQVAPLAPAKPRHGIAAVLDMAGDEASLARRGISQRSPGLRLRALADKAGRPFEQLIQMVADGLPASALAADLGLLGLHLASNPPGNLNPYRLDGPARVFNPGQTGVAEALGDSIGPGKGGSSVGGSTAGGSASPIRERSSASGGRSSTANGSVGPSRAEEQPVEPDEEEEDPLDSSERPEGMDDTLWIRLLEFRQTRADLELEAEDAWRRVSLLTAQLDWMEAEDAEMEAQVEEAGARAAALRDGAVRLSLDVYIAYRLKNGQVELPERPGDVVGAGDVLADALILHRNRVEALNEEVLSRGEGKIEILDTLRQTRRKIHLAQWETEAAEIAGQHAAQRLTELQLLHVTKDLQAALRDPTVVDRLNEEARLAVVWQSAANLHSHRLDQRKRQLAALTTRVSRGGVEQGELSVAEAAAEAAYQESTRMHVMLSYAKAVEDAGHRRHMRNIVSNSQLRTIAQQQAEELEKLNDQLRAAHARNFPALAPLVAWMPPDYRPPRPGSPGGGSVGGASSATAAGAARSSRGGSRTSTAAGAGSRPASALPLPGVQRRASSLPRSSATSGGGGGSRVGTPVPRGNSALSTIRSGGAGATLTRAYAVAANVATSGGGGSGAGDGRTVGDRRPASHGGSAASRPTSGLRPATTGGRRF